MFGKKEIRREVGEIVARKFSRAVNKIKRTPKQITVESIPKKPLTVDLSCDSLEPVSSSEQSFDEKKNQFL